MKPFIHRIAFLLLSTTTMVVFSEKVFWYVQGYSSWELVLYYSFPVFACLWALEAFRVRSLAGLILIGALYGFLIEGVLTPVMYEAGLLDPFMPAYFVGWHGLLGVVFGWYLLHRWLVHGQWKHLLVSGALIGFFWGVWSLPYRLPESIAEFEALIEQGEHFIPGAWPGPDYILYVLTFTVVLIAAHWLLGRLWLTAFRPSKWELGFFSIALLALFGITVVPVVPFGLFKLGALLGLVLFGLTVNRRRVSEGSLLHDLVGPVQMRHALALLVMPVMAGLVYVAAELIPPSEDLLRTTYELSAPLQALLGAVIFAWALFATIRRKPRPEIPVDEGIPIT